MATATSKGTVVVADDEPRDNVVLATRLRALGYEALQASQGDEALRILQSRPVDLVLSDVKIPIVDGFDLTRRIRGDATLAGLPVVLMTARDDSTARVRGLQAGADDFLTKPVNLTELELRVRSQVRLRSLAQELGWRSDILGGPVVAEQSPSSGQVFVLDEDPPWRSILATRLIAAGYTVVGAANLVQGIAEAAAADTEVVVFDLTSREVSGADCIQRFRAAYHATGRRVPPMLVVTGVEDLDLKLACLRQGADDYLVKPIDPPELQARVLAQVRRSRLIRAAHQRLEQSRPETLTDALTGLFNRRFLDEDLARRLRRARAGHGGFVLALLELDEFKLVKSTWGHVAAEAVQRAVARRLAAGVRQSDLVCAYGGDQTAIVFPATPLPDALTAMDHLRRSVAGLVCPPLAAGEVTISAGLAEWDPADQPPDLLERADAALRGARGKGRNRVEASAGRAE